MHCIKVISLAIVVLLLNKYKMPHKELKYIPDGVETFSILVPKDVTPVAGPLPSSTEQVMVRPCRSALSLTSRREVKQLFMLSTP